MQRLSEPQVQSDATSRRDCSHFGPHTVHGTWRLPNVFAVIELWRDLGMIGD